MEEIIAIIKNEKNVYKKECVWGYSVRNYLYNLFITREKKGQKTDWIQDLMSFSEEFHEYKLSQMIEILSRGSEEKPIYIGELAYCVKDKKFTRFDKALSRINQMLEIYIKLLREQDLIEIKANSLYLGEDESVTKNTTYGLWLKKDVKLEGFERREDAGLRDVLDEPAKYEGKMLSDKYSKQICKGYDRCAETIDLLNSTQFSWDERICEFEGRPEDGYHHQVAWMYYEGKVLKRISVKDKNGKLKIFYISFAPDKRLRLYCDSDVGNYIGLKQVRARIAFAHVEQFEPDMIED